MKTHAKGALELVEKIRPLLAGHPPQVQSGALADLVAMWLAGHQYRNNLDLLDVVELRKVLFARWSKTMWELVPINSAAVRERMEAAPGIKSRRPTKAPKENKTVKPPRTRVSNLPKT